jgi:putative membrane protein
MNEENTPGKTSSPAPAQSTDKGAGGESLITKIISGFTSMLGFGKVMKKEPVTSDVNTNLAHERTDLAMERTYLAADRTLMGWIRTALSMISFGFTIGKLGQVMHEVNVKGIIGRTRTMSIENIAYFLVILGSLALLGAIIQHWQRIHELYEMGLPHKLSLTFFVAIVLTAVGGFALSALILAL